MLTFYVCVAWGQNTDLFFPHILWWWILILVIVFQQLQKIAIGSTFWFSAPSLFSVLEAGCFELFLIITNWLNKLSVGWSSKEDFLSTNIRFPALSKRVQNVRKAVFIHSQQSQIVPSSPNLIFLSQLGPSPCYISTNCSRHKNTLSRGHLDYKWAHMTFP